MELFLALLLFAVLFASALGSLRGGFVWPALGCLVRGRFVPSALGRSDGAEGPFSLLWAALTARKIRSVCSGQL